MPVPSSIADLSQTPGSNYPTGSESPIATDNYLREYAAYIAQLRDGKNFTDPVTLASATTTDIGAQNSLFVEITGTTTITGFGTTYNGPRFLRFTGILILTHNATTLNLPGGANITTAAGDTAIAIPNSTPNGWNVVAFNRASGAPLLASSAGADIASAATLPLAARTGNIVRVTGTTASTSTDLENGGWVICIAAGAWPLTYHATNMPVQGGVSYTCAAGDMVIFVRDGSGALSIEIVRKNGKPVYGLVLGQIQSYFTGASASGTTTIPNDNTIPQNTEGDQYLSVAITPKDAASTLEIDVQLILNSSAGVGNALIAALFVDSAADALAATFEYIEVSGGGFAHQMNIKHRMTAGSTSAMTFKVRAGCNAAGTTSINGSLGGVLNSYITVKEYLP